MGSDYAIPAMLAMYLEFSIDRFVTKEPFTAEDKVALKAWVDALFDFVQKLGVLSEELAAQIQALGDDLMEDEAIAKMFSDSTYLFKQALSDGLTAAGLPDGTPQLTVTLDPSVDLSTTDVWTKTNLTSTNSWQPPRRNPRTIPRQLPPHPPLRPRPPLHHLRHPRILINLPAPARPPFFPMIGKNVSNGWKTAFPRRATGLCKTRGVHAGATSPPRGRPGSPAGARGSRAA